MKDNKKRLVYFDMLKLFAIFLVIVGHCVQYLLPSSPYEEPLYVYIYSFHMPLFMIIAGFFSYNSGMTLDMAWGGVKKRFFQLIIPSLLWMIIHGIMSYYIYNDYSSLSIKEILLDETFNTLWFLKSLFICYLVYVIIALSNNWIKVFLTIGIIATFSFVSWFHLKLMLPSFFVGVFLRKNKEIISMPFTLIFSGLCFAICLIGWNADFFTSPSGLFRSMAQGNYEPMVIHLWRTVFSIIIGVFGSVFFISMFGFLFNNRNLGALSKYGQYTLSIYIIQTILLETVMPHYILFEGSSIWVYLIIIPITSLLILSVSIYLYKLLSLCELIDRLLFGNNVKPSNINS